MGFGWCADEMLRVQYSFCTVCSLGRFGLIDKLSFFFSFLFTYTVCKHIIILYIELHLQVLGPTGDWHCSNCCCCPCAHLCPWSGAVNKGTAAGLWSLAPYGVGKVVLLVGGGDVWPEGCRHISLVVTELLLSAERQAWVYSQCI